MTLRKRTLKIKLLRSQNDHNRVSVVLRVKVAARMSNGAAAMVSAYLKKLLMSYKIKNRKNCGLIISSSSARHLPEKPQMQWFSLPTEAVEHGNRGILN